MKTPCLWLVVASLLPFGFAACQQKAKTQSPQKDDAVIAVHTAPVGKVNIAESVYASGLVSSDTEARLSFKTGGIIQKIMVNEGQKVRRGQLLATLNLTEINAQVNQSRQSADKAERDLQRLKSLYADTAATLEQLQNVTTASEVARQNLTIAQFNRNYSQLRSPVEGTVVKKYLNEGELVAPGALVLYVAATGQKNWVVRLGVSDKDWVKLDVGNRANVTLDAYPDDTFTGAVTELAQAADAASKLYEVEIQVNANGKRFAPGLFAKVEIIPGQTRSYATVPVEAIVEGNGKSAFVYVLADVGGKVKKLPVQIGFFDDRKVMITKGLENVKEVVTAGSAFLTTESSVTVALDSVKE